MHGWNFVPCLQYNGNYLAPHRSIPPMSRGRTIFGLVFAVAFVLTRTPLDGNKPLFLLLYSCGIDGTLLIQRNTVAYFAFPSFEISVFDQLSVSIYYLSNSSQQMRNNNNQMILNL
jgi:hypothetical protein